MNRKVDQFDWGDDDLADLKAVKEQPKSIHPDIIAEVPGVKTEDMYAKIIGPAPISDKENPPSYAECALRVRTNEGLYTDDRVQEVDKK